MPRAARVAPGGQVYHVLNRANGRRKLFRTAGDYVAFFRVLGQAMERHPTRLLAWCVMPTHWHVVAWPREEGELSKFFGYLGLTHAARWQAAHGEVGSGHVYQGRFKSFMVERDEHLWWVMRYVERNPLRAGLVERAEEWPWSSLGVRVGGAGAGRGWPEDLWGQARGWLGDPGVELPRRWAWEVNRPQSGDEESAMRVCIERGRPLGSGAWVERAVERWGLGSTMRPRGRPKGKAGER